MATSAQPLPINDSMVTQTGKAPEAMYHLEWGPLSPKLPPGYLVGGPNHQNMGFRAPDAPAKALLWEATTHLRSGVETGPSQVRIGGSRVRILESRVRLGRFDFNRPICGPPPHSRWAQGSADHHPADDANASLPLAHSLKLSLPRLHGIRQEIVGGAKPGALDRSTLREGPHFGRAADLQRLGGRNLQKAPHFDHVTNSGEFFAGDGLRATSLAARGVRILTTEARKRMRTTVGLLILAMPVACAAGETDDHADAGISRERGDVDLESPGPAVSDPSDPDAGDEGPLDRPAGEEGTASDRESPLPVDCRTEGDETTTLALVNGCSATLTYRGSDITGGTVEPGASICVDIGSATETLSARRYWGWTGEDPGDQHYTLAEFTFNTDFHDFDWYNISHVDAHNLTMRIVPVNRPDCDTLTCSNSLLEDCPAEGRYSGADGDVIACVSPDRDDGQSPVAQHFESCDEGYAWSLDDHEGSDPSPVRACAAEDWDIIFCPESQ